ncbi:MAG: glycosyltransferase family 87 protein [Candidatus Omnitrophica bacterium]|nr:glycosyltransferase family 87 protein [Candidatus Omnitrophota bacterium]MDD5352438.1 glycosyltransferase family 87 protein [Candidatus Omnitrophota bacterium]MDD5550036.1 glycosyltransferase family 87 protein [Candidatus Omnitrophota bacterium]
MKIISYLKDHWKKVLIIAFLFTIFIGRYEYKMPKRNFADFHASYYTGKKMLSGQDIYDVSANRKDGMPNFKYPPLFASITALFALTSERTAATIWFIFNFILIIIFMYYSGKMIFKDKLSAKQKNWIYFWSLFLASRFYMHNFDEGQVNFLMMTTLFLGIYASSKNKDFLGGLLIGFSILVKYMGTIFVPYFLFKRKFKLIFYIFVSQILFWLLPALFWGWQKNLTLQSQYLPFLCKTSLDFNSLSDSSNQSLMSMIMRFFSAYGGYGKNILNLGDYFLGFLTGACVVLLYLLCLLPTRNKADKKDEVFDNVNIGMISVCAALLNPNAWTHAFIFLTYGYMTAIFYLFKVKFLDKITIGLLILSFLIHSFSASFFSRWAGSLFEMYSFITIGAIILFIALSKIKFFPVLTAEN